MMKDDGRRKGQNTSTHKNPEKGLKLETPKTERKEIRDRTSNRELYPEKKNTQDTNKRR